MSFQKIVTHPDKNTIIKMLTQGQGVRAVAKYLREKYPKNKELHVSVPTLQHFRQQKLNIEGEALAALKKTEKEKHHLKEIEKGENCNIQNTYAYKKAVDKAIDMHVDIRKELSDIIVLVKSRIEMLFNKAELGDATINEEMNLQKYFPILSNTLDKWMKYIEKVADQTFESNININVIEDQVATIREAIWETLQEMKPDLASKFMTTLDLKMKNLSYRKPSASFGKIQQDVNLFGSQVKEDVETIDVEDIGDENYEND